MDKAFVQHAKHDIHRHHCRHDQPDGAAELGLEGQRAALELGGDIDWQVDRFLRVQNGLYRIAERIIIRHVKREGRYRELIQVINGKRRETLLDFGDGAKRHNPAVAAGQTDGVHCRQPWRGVGVMFQHDAILIRLGVDGRNQALAKGVIQGVIDIRHADAKTAGAVAVNVYIRHQTFVLPVAADVRKLRKLLEFFHQLRHPGAERIQ